MLMWGKWQWDRKKGHASDLCRYGCPSPREAPRLYWDQDILLWCRCSQCTLKSTNRFVEIMPQYVKWYGKDFCVTWTYSVILLLLNQTKGPNGRTYIENISDLILQEKYPVSRLQPQNASWVSTECTPPNLESAMKPSWYEIAAQ